MAGSCCDTAVAQEPPNVPALAGLPHQYASFTAPSLIFACTLVDNSLCDLPFVRFDQQHNSCNPSATCLRGIEHIKIRFSMASWLTSRWPACSLAWTLVAALLDHGVPAWRWFALNNASHNSFVNTTDSELLVKGILMR